MKQLGKQFTFEELVDYFRERNSSEPDSQVILTTELSIMDMISEGFLVEQIMANGTRWYSILE